jgi:alpha-glucosidase
MAPDVATRNVAVQDPDPGSVLSAYRRLIALRRQHPALQVGSYRELGEHAADLLAYERATVDESIVVAINFGGSDTSVRLRTGRRWTVLYDTQARSATELRGGDPLRLAPCEAVILKAI